MGAGTKSASDQLARSHPLIRRCKHVYGFVAKAPTDGTRSFLSERRLTRSMNNRTFDQTTDAVAASSSVERLARIGYVVHGLLYVVIGILAAKLAWGARGKLTDPSSVIVTIYNQPLGKMLVVLIAVGMVCYALWRFIQTVADPDRQGKSLKGLIVRAGRFISGIGYFGLALFSVRLIMGNTRSDTVEINWARNLLIEPIGAVAGLLGAVTLLGIAGDDIRKSCTNRFGERIQHHKMWLWESLMTKCAGSWGVATRAVVLIFGSAFFIRAVIEADPSRAKGFEGILASMFALPHGHLLLGLISLGLVSYGVFMTQVGLRRRHPF